MEIKKLYKKLPLLYLYNTFSKEKINIIQMVLIYKTKNKKGFKLSKKVGYINHK